MECIKGEKRKFTKFNKTKFYKTGPPPFPILHQINLGYGPIPLVKYILVF